MKKLSSFVIVALVAVLIMAIVLLCQDREKPELEVPSTKLDIACQSDKVFEDVKAIDNKDGDITDGVFLENFNYDYLVQTKSVVYVSIDSSGNVAKKSRPIIINSKAIEQKEEIIFEQEKNSISDLASYFIIKDECNNEIEEALEYDGDINFEEPGSYKLLVSLKNNPSIKLETVVTIKKKQQTFYYPTN